MKNLTTSEAAERLGVAPVTVRLWCRQRRFPNAYPESTPRGDVWYIPEADLDGVEPMKPGPKPSSKRASEQTAVKTGNGRSMSKKKNSKK